MLLMGTYQVPDVKNVWCIPTGHRKQFSLVTQASEDLFADGWKGCSRDCFSTFEVPAVDCAIIADRDKLFSIACYGNLTNPVIMGCELLQACPAGPIPETNRVIPTAGGQFFVVGKKCQGTNWPCMSGECLHELSGEAVPQFDQVIMAAGSQVLSVLAKGDMMDPGGSRPVNLQAVSFFPSRPDLDFSCQRSAGNLFLIGAERVGENGFRMAE